jgi:hypothetical protein
MNSTNAVANGMTVEAARAVKWNSRNPRPIGELLDEGFLTQSDLQWAAERAFNLQQKRAAQVLLDVSRAPNRPVQRQVPQALLPELAGSKFSIGLSMEQVRVTEWPFSQYQSQPMGMLVDKQQLTLKDLGYAAENARNERVRQSAIALLLVRLNQVVTSPPSAAGLLHVVSRGRSYAERRQLNLAFVQGLIGGGILGALLLSFILSLIITLSLPAKPLPPNAMSPTVIIILVAFATICLALIALLRAVLDQIMNRLDKQIKSHRKGQEGEERVTAAMHSVLDGEWFLFRNIVLPGRNQGDLDFVLVGPTGIWAIEIKHYTGEYRNIGAGWEYRIKNRWKIAKNNPGQQASDNSARLSNFLKADGIQQWVTPAVIWANPEAPLTVENPSVTVWTLDRLRDELDNILQIKPIPEDKRQQIVDKLTKLCAAQKQKAAAEAKSG